MNKWCKTCKYFEEDNKCGFNRDYITEDEILIKCGTYEKKKNGRKKI